MSTVALDPSAWMNTQIQLTTNPVSLGNSHRPSVRYFQLSQKLFMQNADLTQYPIPPSTLQRIINISTFRHIICPFEPFERKWKLQQHLQVHSASFRECCVVSVASTASPSGIRMVHRYDIPASFLENLPTWRSQTHGCSTRRNEVLWKKRWKKFQLQISSLFIPPGKRYCIRTDWHAEAKKFLDIVEKRSWFQTLPPRIDPRLPHIACHLVQLGIASHCYSSSIYESRRTLLAAGKYVLHKCNLEALRVASCCVYY
jgi:hypothetical protein